MKVFGLSNMSKRLLNSNKGFTIHNRPSVCPLSFEKILKEAAWVGQDFHECVIADDLVERGTKSSGIFETLSTYWRYLDKMKLNKALGRYSSYGGPHENSNLQNTFFWLQKRRDFKISLSIDKIIFWKIKSFHLPMKSTRSKRSWGILKTIHIQGHMDNE